MANLYELVSFISYFFCITSLSPTIGYTWCLLFYFLYKYSGDRFYLHCYSANSNAIETEKIAYFLCDRLYLHYLKLAFSLQ